MALLIIFVLVNIFISVYLEKSKGHMKVASIIHAVGFTVVLFFAMVAQDGFIGDVMRDLLGDYYEPMHYNIVYGDTVMISPLMVIEIVVPLLVIAVSAVTAVKVVEYVRTRRSAPFVKRESAHKTLLFRKAFSPLLLNKIYIRNCVIRC